ncbi:MAG: hypothetical protein OEZ59_03315 [Deltaproteobacteria bacterium]|nr:hypothetical protein [Deltaproteobacteria bacterium]
MMAQQRQGAFGTGVVRAGSSQPWSNVDKEWVFPKKQNLQHYLKGNHEENLFTDPFFVGPVLPAGPGPAAYTNRKDTLQAILGRHGYRMVFRSGSGNPGEWPPDGW